MMKEIKQWSLLEGVGVAWEGAVGGPIQDGK